MTQYDYDLFVIGVSGNGLEKQSPIRLNRLKSARLGRSADPT